jgi:hypothetical protein
VASPANLGTFCLIGFVAGKFPGYTSLSHYITKNWKHHANFTMHVLGGSYLHSPLNMKCWKFLVVDYIMCLAGR